MKHLRQVVAFLTALVWVTANATDIEVVASLTDGAGPHNELVQGPDGVFYGTAHSSGNVGVGTVFRVTSTGVLTTLITFDGGNGAWPLAGLTLDGDGRLWGTCSGGVAGDLFRLTLDGQWTNWFPFYGTVDGTYPLGQQPEGTLVPGNDDYLYGTTSGGGAFTVGAAFKVSRLGEVILVAPFPSFPGPNEPHAGLTLGRDGRFYGTTYYGGPADKGTVFQLTTNGTLITLANFRGTNGASPKASLVQGRDGYFYGTTLEGGTNGSGTIFRITPNGVLTSMFSFDGENGASPSAKLFLAADGNFYGTTSAGGSFDAGTVFKFTPDGTLTTLASFSGFNGATPLGGLIMANDGRFYGTASEGGDFGKGVVYRLTIPLSIKPSIDAFSATPFGAGILLQLSGTPGYPFIVMAATNLLNPVQWVSIVTNLAAADGHWGYLDTQTGGGQKFYRAVAQ